MCRLLESIKVRDGIPMSLRYHQWRMNRSLSAVYRKNDPFILKEHLKIPEFCQKGTWKARVMYDNTDIWVEYIPYIHKKLKSFQLVYDDSINYEHKFCDRQIIERSADMYGDKESDIIFIKNGLVTDASYSNLVFIDAGGSLYTPSDCLLAGTKRQFYLDTLRIKPRRIQRDKINNYTHVSRINAMLDLGEDAWLPLDSVNF